MDETCLRRSLPLDLANGEYIGTFLPIAARARPPFPHAESFQTHAVNPLPWAITAYAVGLDAIWADVSFSRPSPCFHLHCDRPGRALSRLTSCLKSQRLLRLPFETA